MVNRPEIGAPTEVEARSALERVLATMVFQRSEVLATILRFVVEETMAGRQHSIKAYTIATRVLGRPADFDSSTDPVVRVHAGRLRRRLRDYYATDGADDLVRIDLPTGGYVPVFSRSSAADESSSVDGPGDGPSGFQQRVLRGPAVAVLPFVAIGASDEGELIAEGLSEELTMALVQYEGLAVIARQSTLRYKGSIPTVEQVGRDLGVRFVVTGSVRKSGETVLVAAHLNDATDSSQLWAESFERDITVSGIFEMQNEIAATVVTTLSDEYGVITRRMVEETRGKRPEDLSVYEAALLFYQYNQMPDNESNLRVRSTLEQALERDPDFALGWALLGETYIDCHNLDFDPPDDAIDRGHRCVHKALNLDPSCQQAQSTAAYVNFVLGEYKAAIESATKAVELNPNSAFQVATSAFWMGLSGELDRAVELLERVDPLVPNKPGWLRLVPLLHHLDNDDLAAAFGEATRFCTPQLAWDPLLRAATAALGGNDSAAEMAMREFNRLFPEVAEDPEPYIRGFVHTDRHVEKLLDGLERAAELAQS